MNCSICNENIEGFGNNAQPINNGRCCDDLEDLMFEINVNTKDF